MKIITKNMKEPQYTSTPNDAYDVVDKQGNKKKIWHVRSCAVTMLPIFYDRANKDYFIPMGKRGPAAADNNGKWCLPCGYVDWDEDASQTAYRETKEELGLFLEPIAEQQEKIDYLILALDDQPWNVTHSKEAQRQNITLHFAVVVEWEGELPELTTKFNEVEGEVSELAWWSYNNAIIDESDESFAFNHNQKIKDFMFILSPYMENYNQNKR